LRCYGGEYDKIRFSLQKINHTYSEKIIIFAPENLYKQECMTPVQIEKLKKEAAKAGAALQSEKKKNQAFREENRRLHKKSDGMEGGIFRSKAHNVRLQQSPDEELKKHSIIPQQRFEYIINTIILKLNKFVS
jgi:hypothetical protein